VLSEILQVDYPISLTFFSSSHPVIILPYSFLLDCIHFRLREEWPPRLQVFSILQMSSVRLLSPGQQYEFLLYGAVSQINLPTLLHRLRGLCDFATSGGIPFTDREIVLKIGSDPPQSAKLHVRQSIDQPEAPWILSYHGQMELDASKPTAVRTCVRAGCSQNLLDFLRELGYIPVTEIIMKGYIFRKKQMRILVFQICQPNESGDVESAQPFSNNYLVELSAVAASGQDAIGNEMKTFAEHLKSYPLNK
jgi:mediator of RNA polymerase II transcription subunit 18